MVVSEENFTVEKWIWTDADLDRLSFHDVKVRGFASRVTAGAPGFRDVLFDIDFILAWFNDGPGPFRFAVSPATLVFEHAAQLTFEGEPWAPGILLEMDSLGRQEIPLPPWGTSPVCEWTLDGFDGSVSLKAPGFKLYLRRAPVVTNAQRLDDDVRGGFSFVEGRVDLQADRPR